MTFGLHNLKPHAGSKKKRTRVGRGHGTGIGTYSGRGIKGQRARSGGRNTLKLKGIKQAMQALPKLGGFTSAYQRLDVVNIRDLEQHFQNNAVITIAALKAAGLVPSASRGVKVLGDGAVSKAFIVKVTRASAAAAQAITKAGGKVFVTGEYKRPKKAKS